ncbi:hypothetical protein KEM55_002807 [Ascosphaera atra]|nr:hypothetical protein KEM55_002807 [Ascosphaera atra]
MCDSADFVFVQWLEDAHHIAAGAADQFAGDLLVRLEQAVEVFVESFDCDSGIDFADIGV